MAIPFVIVLNGISLVPLPLVSSPWSLETKTPRAFVVQQAASSETSPLQALVPPSPPLPIEPAVPLVFEAPDMFEAPPWLVPPSLLPPVPALPAAVLPPVAAQVAVALQ